MLLWGVFFSLYALTRFELPVRHGHWGHSDPYKDAFRRHGLVRWLSIPSELQWLAGESFECYAASMVICHFQFHSFLRMFLNLKTRCAVKQHSWGFLFCVILLGYKAHVGFPIMPASLQWNQTEQLLALSKHWQTVNCYVVGAQPVVLISGCNPRCHARSHCHGLWM